MQSAPPAGAAGTLTIATSRDCTWAVSSGASWIVITAGSTGQGDGSAAYRIAANTDPSTRRGTIDVNSTQVAITQDAACRFTVNPASATVPSDGGSLTVTVESGGTCGWTAVSQTDWISVGSGSSGTGNGSVKATVAANGGVARSGTLLVAGQTITIAQSAAAAPAPVPPPPAPVPPIPCTFTIQPASESFGAAGGSGSIALTTPAGCGWTATSSADWVVISGTASGTGNATLNYIVSPNAGSDRKATISAGGQVFTISQTAAPCTFVLASSSQSFTENGGTGSVAITARSSCAWTAASSAEWIVITAGANGTGDGAVSFSVGSNPGAARSGAITIAGQVFAITQSAAPCAFTIAPMTQSVSDGAASGSITVTTGSACAWTAVANVPWITVTSGAAGTGNGTIAFSIAANTGAARTGTVSIANQTFTVSQAAPVPPPCTYAVAPLAVTVAAAGGSNTAIITTGPACAWTATSNADWLTFTGAASGTGSGTVGFAATANSGAARAGTLTIAGQTVTVNQAAANPN